MRIDRLPIRLIACAIGAALLLAALGAGHYRLVAARSARMAQLEKELEQKPVPAARFERVASQVRSEQRRLTRINQRIPAQLDIGRLVERFGQVLARTEVSGQNISTGAIQQDSRFRRLPLTLRFRTSYDRLYEVLSDLERHQRLLRPMGFTVQYENASNRPLSVALRIETFAEPSRQPSP